MVFQIASYPFDLSVTSEDVPELARQLHDGLKVVFEHFRQGPRSAEPVIHHEAFAFESDAGLIEFLPDQHTYHVNIQLDTGASEYCFGALVEEFEATIVSHAVRESPTHLSIHAACLCRDDDLILLVAESGTGKTTLSLGLTTRGYRMLTDDIVIVDLESLYFHPLPRSPKVRDGALEQLQQTTFNPATDARRMEQYVVLAEKFWQMTPVPGPPSRVYFLKRSAESPPGQQAMTLTDGLIEILPHSNLLALDPDLEMAADYFAQTQFFALNLSTFLDDLDRVAGQ